MLTNIVKMSIPTNFSCMLFIFINKTLVYPLYRYKHFNDINLSFFTIIF